MIELHRFQRVRLEVPHQFDCTRVGVWPPVDPVADDRWYSPLVVNLPIPIADQPGLRQRDQMASSRSSIVKNYRTGARGALTGDVPKMTTRGEVSAVMAR